MAGPAVDRDVVIAGGGPAGMMAGYILARAGLRVTVLEKHADFLRDFRGDTIHPSTITLLDELGLRERFLELPLTRIETMDAVIDGHRVTLVDFGTLPTPDDFLVFAPQWDFLSFLAREGAGVPGFELLMSTEATGLIVEGERVVGVRAGQTELRATLTVAADGRASALRSAAGLTPDDLGAPIDVLWFDLPKPSPPPPTTLGYLDGYGVVLTIDRDTYYQGGYIIRKGGFDELRAAGLGAFHDALVRTAPVLGPVVASISDWSQVKLLSVQLDRLPTWWRDGFVCIGDAAHAMSPVFGVGINYAIQDAVALANAVAAPLGSGGVPTGVLAAFQARRSRPVERMQRIQQLVHARIARAGDHGRAVPTPARLAITALQPFVRRLTARLIGRGFLPEHLTAPLRS